MKTLSIFIDESGDFGPYNYLSPYYIVVMAFHDQAVNITEDINFLDERLHQSSDGVVENAEQEAVNENFRSAAAIVRTELEKAHWIEGINTPKLDKPTDDEASDLTDIDYEIVEYAIRKWRESGKSFEFHVLQSSECKSKEHFIRSFLRLWLY